MGLLGEVEKNIGKHQPMRTNKFDGPSGWLLIFPRRGVIHDGSNKSGQIPSTGFLKRPRYAKNRPIKTPL